MMNAKQPRISVIIPTYNYGKFLGTCIESVIQQEMTNLEIIVVDDGSTDNTADVANKYDKQIRYVYQEKRGLSAARNTGLKYATGEFVQFLDSDDLIGPGTLGKKFQYLLEHPTNKIAVCRNKTYSGLASDGTPKANGQWFLHTKNLGIHLLYFNIAPPHAFLVCRDTVEQVGLFDESLKACEDYDYWLRAAALGHVPQYCKGGIVYYRRHPASMSANHRNQYYHDALLHYRIYDLFVKNHRDGFSVAHWLAFFAGVLTTLTRKELMEESVYGDLISFFVEALNLFSQSCCQNTKVVDAVTLGYWMIIQQRLAELQKSKDPQMRSVAVAAECLVYSKVFEIPGIREIIRIVVDWWSDPVDALNVARSIMRRVKTY